MGTLTPLPLPQFVRLRQRPAGSGDEGSATLETAICAGGLFVLFGLTIAWGVATVNASNVDNAAKAAARSASLAVDAETAVQDGRAAAEAALEREGWSCSSSSVNITTSGFAVEVGEAATVTATVECTVPLSQLSVPGLPGSKTVKGSFTSVIDQFRDRG